MTDKSTQRIFALVLAAGAASRFGSTKQLAQFEGLALARRSMNLANDCCGDRAILVVGHDWQAVRDSCAEMPGFLVFNDAYADGLGGSIACAIRAVAHVADAVLVLLADQALITAQHLRALCNEWTGDSHEIVATTFGKVIGAPALFPRGCFDDLAVLRGDSGGRHLFEDSRFTLRSVTFENAAVDIDTPNDLASLRSV